MTFTSNLMTNILKNTKAGQAYMPIIFSQYKSRQSLTDNFLITDRQGFWRNYGFGMVSIFKEDFEKSGGYDQEIVGWGMEDVKFCDQVLKEE